MSMNRDSNSPTPQRTTNKMVMNHQGGAGLKLPSQIKSINGINKMQRDSIGESNVAEYEGRMGMMQQTPNFYDRDGGMNTIGMQASSYDNQMNRFSPKVSLGQDINAMFSGGAATGSHNGQFQALNNKLKQKKQQH